MIKAKILIPLMISILLSTSCQYLDRIKPALYPADELIGREWVSSYLAENVGISGFGGIVFCAYELLENEVEVDGSMYIWALCQEYYLNHGTLTAGSGISIPVALQTEMKEDQIEITEHLVPRDGEGYGPDVREIFPRSTWPQILPEDIDDIEAYNSRANALSEDAQMQARDFYED